MTIIPSNWQQKLEKGVKLVLVAASFRGLVDCYWLALADFQNILEDVSGADGRIEYLRMLGLKLASSLKGMEQALINPGAAIDEAHLLALAFRDGVSEFDISSDDLRAGLALETEDAEDLKTALLKFGSSVLTRMPGDIPEAQGTTGQRQILNAMRDWSVTSEAVGEDLGFLAARLAAL